jgi:hypothetical protein
MPEDANTARQVGSREVRLASAAEHSRNVSRDVVLRSRSKGENHLSKMGKNTLRIP